MSVSINDSMKLRTPKLSSPNINSSTLPNGMNSLDNRFYSLNSLDNRTNSRILTNRTNSLDNRRNSRTNRIGSQTLTNRTNSLNNRLPSINDSSLILTEPDLNIIFVNDIRDGSFSKNLINEKDIVIGYNREFSAITMCNNTTLIYNNSDHYEFINNLLFNQDIVKIISRPLFVMEKQFKNLNNCFYICDKLLDNREIYKYKQEINNIDIKQLNKRAGIVSLIGFKYINKKHVDEDLFNRDRQKYLDHLTKINELLMKNGVMKYDDLISKEYGIDKSTLDYFIELNLFNKNNDTISI